MTRRLPLIMLAVLSVAGCQSAEQPVLSGRDALGKPIYTLGGERLAAIEATANSNCPGVTRPYYRSVTGSGENVNVSYTCE